MNNVLGRIVHPRYDTINTRLGAYRTSTTRVTIGAGVILPNGKNCKQSNTNDSQTNPSYDLTRIPYRYSLEKPELLSCRDGLTLKEK